MLTFGTLFMRSCGLGKGRLGDRTRAHLRGFSWTSGIPPGRFRGNTFMGKIPGEQR